MAVSAVLAAACLAVAAGGAAADSSTRPGYGLSPGSPPAPHLSAPATAATAPAGVLGLDVSNHQHRIGWRRVAGAGYRFAWVKASEGTSFVDADYGRNVAAGEAAGIRIGAYDYAQPHGKTSAKAILNGRAEARFFLAVARPRPGQLRPALDVEVTNHLGPVRMAAWVEAWRATVRRATGYEPMIYTSPYFWATALANTAAAAQRGARLWQAEWHTTVPAPPANNWAERGWSAWQWTDCGGVPGIRGCVDMDIADPPGSGLAALVMGAPNARSLPRVHGALHPGALVRASTGSWSGQTPITVRIRWDRCAADGTGCHQLALGRSYRVTRRDIGSSLRLIVSAKNPYGQAWVEGRATAAVTA